MYNFDEVIERRNTDCAKWDIFKDEDMLPMWVADMDFRCPQEIIDALHRRAEHGVFGYAGAYHSYYTSIINWMKKRHNWEIELDWICSSPGIVPALDMLVRGLTQPGDEVVIQTPVYHPFFSVISNNHCKVIENELVLNDYRYLMDLDDLEKKLNPKVKLLILCSPHNPAGRVWTKSELVRLGELCLKHNVLVISDEIHSDLVFPGHEHQVYASISPELARKCVVCNAPSKTFNIAGIQASSIIIPDESIRQVYQNMARNTGLGLPNVFAITALQAAYDHGGKWLDDLKVYLKDNFDYLQDYIREKMPAVKVISSEGTYLAWLDFRGLNIDDMELEKLIKQEKLMLSPGRIFGNNGCGFQRINIGCPRATLKEGLYRLEKAVNNFCQMEMKMNNNP